MEVKFDFCIVSFSFFPITHDVKDGMDSQQRKALSFFSIPACDCVIKVGRG